MARTLLSPLGRFVALLVVGVMPASAAQLAVVSIEPARNTNTAPRDADLVVDFDRAVDPTSLPPSGSTFLVFGKSSGVATGTFVLENGGLRVRFDPTAPFAAGEEVGVQLTKNLKAADGSFLRSAGFAWRFRTATNPSSRTFSAIDVFTTRIAGIHTRLYGAQATDFDGDGWTDLATVCEDTGDVRMFLSLGDGTGLFGAMLMPPAPTGAFPSPNEAADFDLDGDADLAVVNVASSSVAVLLGDGDGTFAPASIYPVGVAPKGLAVLELNGDGYADLAVSNFGTSDIALLVNDGTGHFGFASFFEGGGSGEYGLASGDMNNDGILDLVVGNRGSQTVVVNLANGSGGFTQAGARSVGGNVWMVALGDVTGEGNLDVSSANGSTGSGSILRGNGAGGISAAQVFSAAAHAISTDLGDLDGDGDLDWILSCSNGGVYVMFENLGTGAFVQDQQIPGAQHPSCSVMLDFDGDGDLDLALTDETDDVVTLMKNDYSGELHCFGDGSGTACPCGNETALGADEGCRNSTGPGGRLAATGTASVSADDLVLTASQLPTDQFGIVYSGLNSIQIAFGDGHRCVSGSVVRFHVKSSGSSGSFVQPNVASLLGASAGQSRRFQGWYRDPAGPCGTAYNLTNAVSIVFAP